MYCENAGCYNFASACQTHKQSSAAPSSTPLPVSPVIPALAPSNTMSETTSAPPETKEARRFEVKKGKGAITNVG